PETTGGRSGPASDCMGRKAASTGSRMSRRRVGARSPRGMPSEQDLAGGLDVGAQVRLHALLELQLGALQVARVPRQTHESRWETELVAIERGAALGVPHEQVIPARITGTVIAPSGLEDRKARIVLREREEIASPPLVRGAIAEKNQHRRDDVDVAGDRLPHARRIPQKLRRVEQQRHVEAQKID